MKRDTLRLVVVCAIAIALSLIPARNIYPEGTWEDLVIGDGSGGTMCNETAVFWSYDGCTMSSCSLQRTNLDAQGNVLGCVYGGCTSSCYTVPGNGAIGPCKC